MWKTTVVALVVAALPAADLAYRSDFYRVEAAADYPAFVTLAVDSLGKNKLDLNVLQGSVASGRFASRNQGHSVEYRSPSQPVTAPPVWSFEFAPKRIVLRSNYSAGTGVPPLVLNFDPILCHATLLGLMNGDGSVRLPALLHLPDRGTFRITMEGARRISLGYDATRGSDNFVKVAFPAASDANPRVSYTLDVVDIYPGPASIADDPRYDGFRRDFLNIFQLNPRLRVLANHAASDPCAFTVYMYSAMAARTPALAEGLTALDILRQTLDRYVEGMKAYGMAGYNNDPQTPYDFLDTYPSLLIAASDYVRATADDAWLRRNYFRLHEWAGKMLSFDRDGDGLLEYPASGNSGSWPEKIKVRPSNWWDTIGFGHADAYANALAYHALIRASDLARRAGQLEDERYYAGRAAKLKAVYLDTFYNPETGVLAGWKSADGKLHDYYFTFLNGAAIVYGLVPHDRANAILDKLLAKMKQVGYNRFDLGLPGNLIPIRRADYAHHDKRFGGGDKEDGSDGFQIYENGGATACYAYFLIEALYQLGRTREADAILFPMLRGFESGGFQGRGPNSYTYDWKAWDGTPWGYEGLLVDGYMTLLAALTRIERAPTPSH
jgi:hypothetical protein